MEKYELISMSYTASHFAFRCFLLLNAVSLGGDTDTLAAIAGAMADAMYGIPDDILAEGRARLPEDLLKVVEKFATI